MQAQEEILRSIFSIKVNKPLHLSLIFNNFKFDSPQVKGNLMSSIKDLIYELLHELLYVLR